MTHDKGLEELFRTSLVTFETLFAQHQGMKRGAKGRGALKQRIERLRRGIGKAADKLGVALEGPEYRFLTPEGRPWYGQEGW